ncbi:uncharacterized protein LOC108034696 [Drosophila biarmipes]|uniref:uncharacterized protein LOC108034696 n=1 Tax=Drosophila biarmipes TaxID=125945 RepID=UPI0007E62CEC|nr:uncharacterized protein LOC108034696 [Drosophila biarmipes]
MDTLTPNNGSKSSSSGSSAASSSMDLGKQQQKEKLHRHPRNGPKKLSRSRSLLQLLSRHLGRHFHHQNHQNDTVYSSQDDIRSSSTDSFSLSYERASHEHECPINGSSLDLEHTSRTSSASACSRYSPGLDYYDQQGHIYVEAVYRPGSAMEQLHPQLHFEEDTSEEGSSNEAEDEVELGHDENENSKPRSASAASAKSSGLHLSRISISSSVSRMLQHFSSPTGNASMRSLSCSSTPLRQPKKSLSPNNSNSSSSSSHSGSSSKSSSGAPASKKEKKQQSILRPPVQYVSMKGMSGLYSRVPSYAVCYPYTLQHMY